jgi:hypothetical protein
MFPPTETQTNECRRRRVEATSNRPRLTRNVQLKDNYPKGEKATLEIFHDINVIGKLTSAYSRFRVMQEWLNWNITASAISYIFSIYLHLGDRWFRAKTPYLKTDNTTKVMISGTVQSLECGSSITDQEGYRSGKFS